MNWGGASLSEPGLFSWIEDAHDPRSPFSTLRESGNGHRFLCRSAASQKRNQNHDGEGYTQEKK